MARTSDVDGARLYSAVREKVLENGRKVTRYMCVETVDRSQFLGVSRDESCGATPKRGQLAQRDRVRLDVTVVNGGEIFSWAGARGFEFRDAAAGDMVTGVLTRDIRDPKRVVLAKAGEFVHGRVLRMQYYAAGRPAWMIAIRFDRLERGDTELPLMLKAMDEGVRQTAVSSGLQKDPGAIADHPEGGGQYVFRGPGDVVLGKEFEMEWQSE